MDTTILERIAARAPATQKIASRFYDDTKRRRIVYTDGASAAVVLTVAAKPRAGVSVDPKVVSSKLDSRFSADIERATFLVPTTALCDWIQQDLWECPLCDGDLPCPVPEHPMLPAKTEKARLRDLALDQHAGFVGPMMVDRRRVMEAVMLLAPTLDADLTFDVAYTQGLRGGDALLRISCGDSLFYFAGLTYVDADACPRLEDNEEVRLVAAHNTKSNAPLDPVISKWRAQQVALRKRTRLRQANE